jgi:hypothetical protein
MILISPCPIGPSTASCEALCEILVLGEDEARPLGAGQQRG